jgi:hypothetical protein
MEVSTMPVPPEFLLIVLLLAAAVVFAYFYLKRAQARPQPSTPRAPLRRPSEPAAETTTDRTSDQPS